ncbi:MAG: AraC family transcriptional regulator [Bacteroides sp.]|nr:AraC family transcriptional regulator [Eubacterium sp.]MCM1417444.1 AraC family transcriptional regulator [Roseburia sp.]MCM1461624.1 AraC family transcriptional regulator [Bacteroides sp.]
MAIIEHAGYYEDPMYGVSHVHTSCEIIYVAGGRLNVTIGGREIRLAGGQSLLIKSRCHHAAYAADDGYRRFISMINPWELRKQLVRPDLFAMLTDTGKSGFIRIENAKGLYPDFEKMTDIFKNGGNIYEELSAALKVLSAFYEEVRPQEERSAERSAKRIADRVRFYIEQNYADNIKVSRLAEESFISEGYLSHAFKSETGMSPREYLTHIRCTRAYELICHTAMKFSDVAENTGFPCANDMSRKIREYYGKSPTEIRFGK